MESAVTENSPKSVVRPQSKLPRSFARDSIERDAADRLEPHSEVEVDSATVFAANMQPRNKPFTTMISHKLPDQVRSQSFAAMRRMRAAAADLSLAVQR